MSSIEKQAKKIDTKIGFNLLPNKTAEIIREKDGIKSFQVITIENLMSIINNSYTTALKEDKVDSIILNETEILPHSKNIKTVKVINYEGDKKKIYLLRENYPTTIKFEDDIFHDVKLPRLLFAISLNNNAITQSKVFAIKDRIVKPQTKLFKYPLSNVHGGGNICFGGIPRPKYEDLQSCFSFPDYFLSTKLNMDNYFSANNSNMSLRPFLEKLSKDKSFDESFLISLNKTFNEL